VQNLLTIGNELPWQQFVVYFTLSEPHTTIIQVSLSYRGIIKKITRDASVSLDKVKLATRRKVLRTGFNALDFFMGRLIETFNEDDEDSQDQNESDDEFSSSSSLLLRRRQQSSEEWVAQMSELDFQRIRNKDNVARVLIKLLRSHSFRDVQVCYSDEAFKRLCKLTARFL
jgi:hypothetical protein